MQPFIDIASTEADARLDLEKSCSACASLSIVLRLIARIDAGSRA
jgi:hypothetical protein